MMKGQKNIKSVTLRFVIFVV